MQTVSKIDLKKDKLMTNCSWRIAKSPFEKIIKFYQSKLLRNLNWQNPLFNRHHGHHHHLDHQCLSYERNCSETEFELLLY